MTISLSRTVMLAATGLAALAAIPAAAQQASAPVQAGAESERPQRTGGVEIVPYIEAAQVLSAELSPGDDVVTYTRLAAGLDAGFTTRNSAASIGVRYERRIGYGDVEDGDTISGIARASLSLVPRQLTFEAGALAARSRVEGGGATTLGGSTIDNDSSSQIYAVYAGPTLQTRVGDLEVSGAYRIGYSRVEAPDGVVLAPGDQPVDYFDDSVSQMAAARVGIAPNTVLPIGVGVGGGWNRQDVSNLDQRIDDRHVRADVVVPVSPTLAVIGGVGYEDVEVSNRDAVRDVNGQPVRDAAGRYVTDTSSPRRISYQTDGLIWDVGVMWRPSDRTALQAVYGRRYGGSTYYGSFSWAASPRTSFNVGVYDNLSGFGGNLVNNLANLPTEFQAFRNPLSGDLGACVAALEGGTCSLANIGSLRSSVFRSRGINASVSRAVGRTSYGLAAGYDRRTYIAAANTALAAVDGLLDENYWAGAYLSQQLDARSGISGNGFVNWFDSGFDSASNGTGYAASVSYYRNLLAGLTGTAAVGVDGIMRDALPDYTNASALVGLRYSF
ncbi:preprotein translocase subunit YajC [Alteraurantiacibacter buctensis]|uniref:Preprotein translocase subunit YajC n=1 Tax=Alteraurantiacibacter buctensis TaxID=1503981 RepID=A0A844Z1K3_9SPHN|nr:preprotein translocase subunit YajC [Alteraurantiacibacter buctensis]MXO72327.1 preprotein translocase subunit YajC [Alteraurantiacibacter buctensis]